MFNRNLLVAASLALVAGATFAQGTEREDQRNNAEESRIQHDEAHGTLNPYYAQHLQRNQQEIRNDERRAASDGRMTPAEREHIRNLQIQQNRDTRRDNAAPPVSTYY